MGQEAKLRASRPRLHSLLCVGAAGPAPTRLVEIDRAQ